MVLFGEIKKALSSSSEFFKNNTVGLIKKLKRNAATH